MQRVTKMAYAQIRSYGMNERVGHLSFPSDEETEMGTKPFSQKLAHVIDEVQKIYHLFFEILICILFILLIISKRMEFNIQQYLANS